jgi:exonuclease III
MKERLLRIVSWNMNHMHRAKVRNEAWDLLRTLDPDIALVQEAVLPDGVVSGYGPPLFTRPWPNRPWGSAILSRVGELTLVWENADKGAVQLATCTVSGIGPLSLANIHSRLDKRRRVIPNLRKTFDAVLPQLGDRFVLGGDLNTARSLAVAYPPQFGHGEFWQDVERWGLREAMPFFSAARKHPGSERQSYWAHWLRNDPPTMGNSLQDDHVFMDAGTFEHLSRCVVWDTRIVRELSDHGPVVVDLELPS